MDWFGFSLISNLSLAAVLLLQKPVLNRKEVDPFAFAIYFQLLIALFALPLAIYSGIRIENFSTILPLIGLMPFFYAFGNILFYQGMKLSEVSKVGIVMTTVPLCTFLGGVILLEESFSLAKTLGLLAIITALLLLSWQKGVLRLERGLGYVLLSSFLFAGAFLIAKQVIDNFSSPFLYQIFGFGLPGILVGVLQPKSIPKIRALFSRRVQFLTFLSALSLITTSFSTLTAYRLGGEISRVIPIVRASAIVVVIFSYLFLRERKDLLKKFIAALLVISGVALLGI